MKKEVVTILAIALFVIVSCTGTPTGDVIAEDEVTIGYMGPLSGEFAYVGIPNLEGIELAINEINAKGGIHGRELRLIVEDDEFTPSKSISAYEKLTKLNGVDVILGPSYGSQLALADRALAEGNLLVNSLDASEELAEASDGLAAIGIYDESIGEAIADDINRMGYSSVSVLYNVEDPFMVLVYEAFIARLNTDPISIRYAGGDQDYRSLLLKAKNPEALVLLGFAEVGPLLKQASEIGLPAQLYTIDALLTQHVLETAGTGAYGVRFPYWVLRDDEISRNFKQRYVAEHGELIDQLFVATGYDAMHIVADAIEQNANEPLIETLKNMEPHTGVTGEIAVDEDGISRALREVIYEYTPEGPIRI